MKKNNKAHISKIKLIIEGLKVHPKIIKNIPPFNILLLFDNFESRKVLFF